MLKFSISINIVSNGVLGILFDVFFWKLVFICETQAVLSNFYIVPHGGIALDPTHFNTTNATSLKEAWMIHDSYVEIGKEIASLQPNLVFLSTPHGISDLNNFVFYYNPTASGFADTDNCQCPPCCYNVTVNLNMKVTSALLQVLSHSKNISALSGFGPPGASDSPFPLRWGEVIPLHFIPGNLTEIVILSHPSRRYSDDVSMIPELLKLGEDLYQYLESIPEKVVVMISADLAHTHSADGPYGFSKAAEPFDKAVGQWVQLQDPSSLVKTAASYVDKALSCGFTGLVMLQGILGDKRTSQWKPELLANYHPSYYGMMVAAFRRENRYRIKF
ncbi:hypothetical protein FSP39_024996 [Pinctada imbricata]|uniref:Extradiol ring-cleavage dioxygenase class III enzyme subunit B domain-containing protein n=1 Tax=Pinctada imbricata TaxID=66713 RepID=A0AA88YGJ1_PINIB|nr:hypothetical protein FSP39_024996 [Pinctada imbricata]